MLISDSFASLCTVSVLALLASGNLCLWHLYVINTLNGLMNTVQQSASDVVDIIHRNRGQAVPDFIGSKTFKSFELSLYRE